ncbi:MAG: hypothetical protein LBB74_02890 [Chitinispirillales bacterium]|jgi:hypothetical protein|nr:hypothetical protein [Chitinispirillales bacterium]
MEKVADEYARIGRIGGPNSRAYLLLRGLAYTDGKAKVYLEKTEAAMKDIFGKKGFKDKARKNLGLYMLYNRVATERSEIGNPRGITKESAVEGLNHMKDQMGAEAFVKLGKAADAYQKIREKYILPYLFGDDTYGAALRDYALNNPNYATFDVVGHIDKAYEGGQSGSLGIHKQVGTFSDIGNPFDATVSNDLKLVALKANNDAIRAVVEMLDTNPHPYTVEPSVKGKDSEGRDIFGESPIGLRKVKYMQNGELHAFDISKEIADVLIHDPRRISAPMKALGWVNQHLQKDFYVKYNIPFLMRNLFRDAAGTIKNIPKANVRKFVRYFPGALGETLKYMTTGKMSGDIEAAYLEGAMHVGRSYDNMNTTDVDSFDRFMGQFDEARQVEYSKNIATRAIKKLWKAFTAPFDFVGSVEETAGKLTGYKILSHDKAAAADIAKRAEKAGVSEAELRAQMTRTAAGTPDFTHGGKWKRGLNSVWLFSNVNIQGARAGLASIRQNPGAWMSKFLLHKVPWITVAALARDEKLVRFAEAMGFSGGVLEYCKFLQEGMQRIPEDHIARGFAHPLPVKSAAPVDEEGNLYQDDNGNDITTTKKTRQLYVRIPGDYTSQVAGAAWYYIAKAISQGKDGTDKNWYDQDDQDSPDYPNSQDVPAPPDKKEPASESAFRTVKSVLSEMGGLSPVDGAALNPVAQVAFAWLRHLDGQQPRDLFTGRDIVPPNMQDMDEKDQLGQMARWTLDKAGPLSGLHRTYDPNENPIKEAKLRKRKALREAIKSGNDDAFDAAYAMPDPQDDRPWAEKALGYPVIGTAGKAFFGMTNYGLREKELEEERKRAARKKRRRLNNLKKPPETTVE